MDDSATMSPIQPGNPITEYSFEDVEHQKFELNVYVNGTFSPGVQIEFPRAKKFSLRSAYLAAGKLTN